ncbi:unnamed protein product, partial [marine sediment metagenome]
GVTDQIKLQEAMESAVEVELFNGTYIVDHQPDATYSVLVMQTGGWLCGQHCTAFPPQADLPQPPKLPRLVQRQHTC